MFGLLGWLFGKKEEPRDTRATWVPPAGRSSTAPPRVGAAVPVTNKGTVATPATTSSAATTGHSSDMLDPLNPVSLTCPISPFYIGHSHTSYDSPPPPPATDYGSYGSDAASGGLSGGCDSGGSCGGGGGDF